MEMALDNAQAFREKNRAVQIAGHSGGFIEEPMRIASHIAHAQSAADRSVRPAALRCATAMGWMPLGCLGGDGDGDGDGDRKARFACANRQLNPD